MFDKSLTDRLITRPKCGVKEDKSYTKYTCTCIYLSKVCGKVYHIVVLSSHAEGLKLKNVFYKQEKGVI